MISATRRWLKRNRTPFAIGFGVIGVGYVATQYVLGKISDARERMSSDRIAREKYIILSPYPHTPIELNVVVFAGDSNKTRRIVPSPS